MEVGMFTFSEINEKYVLQDEYRNKGSTYMYYAHWKRGFTDCRTMIVNITDKRYEYPQDHTLLYPIAFKHFKQQEE